MNGRYGWTALYKFVPCSCTSSAIVLMVCPNMVSLNQPQNPGSREIPSETTGLGSYNGLSIQLLIYEKVMTGEHVVYICGGHVTWSRKFNL